MPPAYWRGRRLQRGQQWQAAIDAYRAALPSPDDAEVRFRIGYACAPEEISENMMKLHQYAIMSAPTTGQMAAAEALDRGDEAVAGMVAEYNRRRNYLIASFAEMGIACHTPAGAFYAFPYVGDLGISAEDFAMRLM